MANNPYVNKVQKADGTVLMDISDTTASTGDVLAGSVFYSASGQRSVGALSTATQSTDGLMSSADKTKLDGIATGATANSISVASGTAAAGSWTSATPPTQTISVTGVTANSTIIVSIASTATQAQYEAAAAGKLLCTAQGAGTITLTCYGDKPTENIPISVLIME